VHLWAQETAQPDEPEITVVVTAERTAQPVSESISSATVVTAKQIREQGAQTVGDALRLVPGVTISQNGQTGSLAIAHLRGTSLSQVLVLVDGQRVSSSAFGGSADLSKFPLADVARIEVIRGPVSSLYGSDAIGGVINIITRQPTRRAGEVKLGFGDFSRQERSMYLSSGQGPVAWQLNAQFPVFSGARLNSDYSAANLSARVLMPSVKGWELSLRGEDYHDSLGLPGSTTWVSPNDRQWWDRSGFDIAAKRDIGPGQLELHGYSIDQELREINPDFFTNSHIMGTTRASEATYRVDRGTRHWIFGGEYRGESYKDVESGSVLQDKEITNRALFVQNRIDLSTTTDVLVGVRMDDHSTAGSKVSPRLGVNHAVSGKTRVRASYAEGFHAPTLVDLYYNNFGTIGNPNLKPEKSRQYELGMNTQIGDDSIDLAVFTNSVVDQIIWLPQPPSPGNPFPGTFMNVDQARQRGIELSWDHRIGNSTRLGLFYTYIDARNLTMGSRLPGIPHRQIGLTLSGKMRSWSTALTGRWTDDRPYNTGIVAGRAVFDLTLTRQSEAPSNPYVVIRNLTNVSYEEAQGYPADRRSIEVGMRSAW
jgi:outer membrane cobalamin receptor